MDWIWNINNKDDQAVILEEEKRKETKKKEESLTNDKLTTQLQQALFKEKEDATTLTMTQWNDSFGCWETSYASLEGRGCLSHAGDCYAHTSYFLFLFVFSPYEKIQLP
jgi:hypothetical protein